MSRMRSVDWAVDVVVGGSVREARRVEAEAAARSVMRGREGAAGVIR